jgi:hypothetical protein
VQDTTSLQPENRKKLKKPAPGASTNDIDARLLEAMADNPRESSYRMTKEEERHYRVRTLKGEEFMQRWRKELAEVSYTVRCPLLRLNCALLNCALYMNGCSYGQLQSLKL